MRGDHVVFNELFESLRVDRVDDMAILNDQSVGFKPKHVGSAEIHVEQLIEGEIEFFEVATSFDELGKCEQIAR